ncbi:MAG: DEAD/DEAH box helicase [Candidatus Neomarinimicrobiota bacterium]
MIKLIIDRNTLSIKYFDQEGLGILNKPIHRIYFRGTLGATFNEKLSEWQIEVGVEISLKLQKLIQHLNKYEIDYELDDNCEQILEKIRDEKIEYNEKLVRGKKAKYKIEDNAKKNIKQTLANVFIRELKDFQIHAVHHLLTVENGANFSVPGSGKTTIALAYFQILRQQGKLDSLLVIGPTSSFQPWEDEFKECFGKSAKSIRLAGRPLEERLECYLLAHRYELILLTYHTAANDVDYIIRMLKGRKYLTVLDESHYIKRPKGGKLASASLMLAPFSVRRIILTGTPMPNSPADLWSQFQFLWYNQHPLGSSDRYIYEIRDREQSDVIDALQERVGPLFFRTTKSQLGLPPQTFKIHRCQLSPLQKRIYAGVAARFLKQLSESPQDRNALREWRRARAVRLLQIASNPALLLKKCDEFGLPPIELRSVPLSTAIEHYADYEVPEKIALVSELANEICSSGEKVIIWSTFVHNLQMIASLLTAYNPVIIHGGIALVSDKDEITREGLIKKFKDNPNCEILIANPAACAESISLHRVCHQAIYLDRSFNCAHYLQSMDRIHRLGLAKTQETCYHLIIAKESIDDVVHDRLKQKMQAMHQILEGDIPREFAGYWSEDLGAEEEVDLELVEKHILIFLSRYGS